jgi:putative addiction module component (TIGR02574 family)
MATIELSHLSPQERLDLIGQLWESLSQDTVPVTQAQKIEIKRRLATLDQDVEQGRDADDIIADLRRREG